MKIVNLKEFLTFSVTNDTISIINVMKAGG